MGILGCANIAKKVCRALTCFTECAQGRLIWVWIEGGKEQRGGEPTQWAPKTPRSTLLPPSCPAPAVVAVGSRSKAKAEAFVAECGLAGKATAYGRWGWIGARSKGLRRSPRGHLP